jgi:hypothetical protein
MPIWGDVFAPANGFESSAPVTIARGNIAEILARLSTRQSPPWGGEPANEDGKMSMAGVRNYRGVVIDRDESVLQAARLARAHRVGDVVVTSPRRAGSEPQARKIEIRAS